MADQAKRIPVAKEGLPFILFGGAPDLWWIFDGLDVAHLFGGVGHALYHLVFQKSFPHHSPRR